MPIFSELLLRTESDTMEIFGDTLTPNFPAHVWTRSSFSIKNTTHQTFLCCIFGLLHTGRYEFSINRHF